MKYSSRAATVRERCRSIKFVRFDAHRTAQIAFAAALTAALKTGRRPGRRGRRVDRRR